MQRVYHAQAEPDELQHHAPELARALLHLRVPDWADDEATTPEDKPKNQQFRWDASDRHCNRLQCSFSCSFSILHVSGQTEDGLPCLRTSPITKSSGEPLTDCNVIWMPGA
jgi:hypothetical protein